MRDPAPKWFAALATAAVLFVLWLAVDRALAYEPAPDCVPSSARACALILYHSPVGQQVIDAEVVGNISYSNGLLTAELRSAGDAIFHNGFD